MSHISRYKTQFVEKRYLLAALRDMGFEPEEGDLKVQSVRGEELAVEIRVQPRLSYPIGFRKTKGVYEIVADWFGVMGVKPEEFKRQLAQRYAYHAAREQLEAQGFALVEESNEAGQIRLLLRRIG
ncbi:MAG: DUF1257 domain-containing protein [Thermanaerothrix sp.]|jgi:hypothetical protein|uniref:DUF1257 domain-containing protein n=1 Tax=Thermanaerothrix solaris TaxID=3058434 RepID=A0ABU3NL06_9CHLR|nr:DUF1257 domain-containing protein [Thermanaerothrix sp. 4228-RoL]MDT8897533.1 DUF1257 domain-containing protein [Thermanaerothrix sp. 4228-RoL]